MPNFEPIDGQPLLYWAVVEHYRTWIVDDGLLRNSLQAPNQILSSEQLRSIARKYGVNRGIYAIDKEPDDSTKAASDGNAAKLAKLLNARAGNWPKGMMARANHCLQLAKDAEEADLTRGVLLSAMTKIMWFLKPDEWTMYDTFASNALNLKERGRTERFNAFYRTLSDLEFLAAAASVKSVLDRHDLTFLWGERVLDKFLMLAGAQDRNWSIKLSEYGHGWLDLLPNNFGKTVRNAAIAVSKDESAKRFAAAVKRRGA